MYIWRASGTYHALFHDMQAGEFSAQAVTHGWSTDSIRWSLGEAGAVANHSVEFSNGARDVLGARERPHLLFDASGLAIALTNGVCPHGNAWNDASASKRDDFSYTLLQPLVGAEPSVATSSSEPPRPPPPVPALPGLADVCGHLDPAERCSPEICDLKPHATVRLAAKTYYQNASIQLPEGAVVVGAGINKTFVISCGAPSNGRNPARRGFILGNHSYLGGFTWQGLQASRGNFDAAVGTPGCRHPNHAHPGAPCQAGCIPEGGDCAGVENATVEHIHVRPFSSGDGWWPLTSSAGWFPVTKPWGDDRRTGSYNLTIRGLISWGSWADGIVSTSACRRRLFSRWAACSHLMALCFRTCTAGTTTSSWRIVRSATVEMTRAPPRDFCLCCYGF